MSPCTLEPSMLLTHPPQPLEQAVQDGGICDVRHKQLVQAEHVHDGGKGRVGQVGRDCMRGPVKGQPHAYAGTGVEWSRHHSHPADSQPRRCIHGKHPLHPPTLSSPPEQSTSSDARRILVCATISSAILRSGSAVRWCCRSRVWTSIMKSWKCMRRTCAHCCDGAGVSGQGVGGSSAGAGRTEAPSMGQLAPAALRHTEQRSQAPP